MELIYGDLEIAIKQALKSMKKDFPLSFLKEQIGVYMGLGPSPLSEHIRANIMGYYYGTISSNPLLKEVRLERTSIFLWALGFSEEDELQKKVIAGIRERDSRFEYPPPEDNRVSYEEIKQIYNEQNKVVERGSKRDDGEQQNKIEGESVEDRVKRLLEMKISTEPDDQYRTDSVIAREVYIEGFARSVSHMSVYIEVAPQKSATGEALHRNRYVVSYRGSPNGEGEGIRTWRALQAFLSEIKGQKARILYNHVANQVASTARANWRVQMIAPLVESTTIYLRDFRGDSILRPYNTREIRFITV